MLGTGTKTEGKEGNQVSDELVMIWCFLRWIGGLNKGVYEDMREENGGLGACVVH